MDFSPYIGEAKHIHALFASYFFPALSLLLVVGVTIEYFRIPLGEIPSFPILLSRTLIAVVLFISFEDFISAISAVTDSIAAAVGDYNSIDYVKSRMAGYLDKFTFSFTDIKNILLVGVSWLCYFLLYWCTVLFEALFYFTWTLLYVFSPLLIACYVLPSTAPVTTRMYRSFIYVCLWKIVAIVISVILWSNTLFKVEELGDKGDWLTLAIYNIILGLSLLMVPKTTEAIFGGGLDQIASSFGQVVSKFVRVKQTNAKRSSTDLAKKTWRRIRHGNQNSNKPHFKTKSETKPGGQK